jgi:hypothetical protein
MLDAERGLYNLIATIAGKCSCNQHRPAAAGTIVARVSAPSELWGSGMVLCIKSNVVRENVHCRDGRF